MTRYVLSESSRNKVMLVLKKIQNKSDVRAQELFDAMDVLNIGLVEHRDSAEEKYILNLAKHLGRSGIAWHLKSDKTKADLITAAREILLGRHRKV